MTSDSCIGSLGILRQHSNICLASCSYYQEGCYFAQVVYTMITYWMG